jgi:arylsulfatase A-like enzyme
VVGFWLLLGLVGCERRAEAPPVPPGARRHALLLVVDTLRAGSLQRASTPNIDALALRGGAAKRAWAAGTWTAPSMIAIFTGASLREHGWDYPMPSRMARQGAYPPIPELPTLAERLSGLGFETAGLYANPIVRPELGFNRGFDHYERLGSDGEAAGLVAEQVAGWDDGERHFLYVHLWGPHQPLHPSAEAQKRWGVGRPWIRKSGMSIRRVWQDEEGALSAYFNAYHAVVEDTDARVGAILAALGSHRDDTVIVLTSDHGELLGEHGRAGHGSWVYEPLTWVPFIAEGAGDIPATVSNAAAADAISRGLGLTLEWPVSLDDALPLVSQREGKVALSPDGRLKGIWDEELSVFDLHVDPGEERALPEAVGALTDARAAWEAATRVGTVTGEPVEVTGDMEEALKALGYIEE